MRTVGIEAMNFFGGTTYIEVLKLAKYRHLDMNRFDNLLMKEKTVALPCEDPVTFGVNAAKPIIDALSEEDRNKIELVITCSESSFDFGKSMSTYIHDYLKLNRNCRFMEVKQACYSGIVGLQTAMNFILSQTSKGAKALLVATDISRFLAVKGGDALSEDWSFAEPSSGAGAVAVLISDKPSIFQLDVGASGYYGYEVMDTCRPVADSEAGDSDLSLASYLYCCEHTYLEYKKRVANVDYQKTFQYLAFHAPFGGMVKGAHRSMMRKIAKAAPNIVEEDFKNRVLPGLLYCQRVGNIMGATTLLSLASTIENGSFETPKRIGCFSYGSGCCSEFFSGISTPEGQKLLKKFNLKEQLDNRYSLSIEEYEEILKDSSTVKFGTRNLEIDLSNYLKMYQGFNKTPKLVLEKINEYHREYKWI